MRALPSVIIKMKTIKELPNDKIVAIDLSTANPKKKIVGTTITNSIDREDWDYIYNLGYNDCKKDVSKLIDIVRKMFHYGGEPNNYIKTDELKQRIEGK